MSASKKLTESAEHDMYIAQLKEVFDGCDENGSGTLERQELLQLCDRLQLDDQSEYLVNELLKNKTQVDFNEFRESFVNILCQTYNKEPSSDEEEGETESESEEEMSDNADTLHSENNEVPVKREMSPKYVVGEKQYGRRSLPVSAEELEDLSVLDDEDIEVASSTKSLKRSITVHDDTESEEDVSESQKRYRRLEEGASGGHADTETYEAEGQLNLMMADIGDLSEEEDYLRGIWTNLGVGRNGYIDIAELARVCSHIGMEQMNDTQLQQLFEKLDADGDGRVSFREFLNELFQHNTPTTAQLSTTPRSKGTTPTRPSSTPTRAQSAQKKLKFPGSEERITPSIVQGAGVTGLFSAVDLNRTGFAKPDAILDLWEKYNVSNGSDVLLALGFDLNAKINLSELSAALEQELLSPEEQSIVYQAALVSYQQEMRHLKSTLEQAVWAKDKLKLDLAEANARNSLLAKEVDERHASMEKSSESKLLSIERKYQDQVKQLQGELDKERESYSTFTASHKLNVDAEMEELKKEEVKLREHLAQAQKEIEKQGRELEEVTGHLDESEKQCQRLQRELDNVEDIHRKLAEYESTGLMSPEEQKFTQEKLQRIEQENMELKDHNDELTAEIEQMKQQITPSRKSGHMSPDTHTPIRKHGSIMSDYIKPVIVKKSCSSSAEFSDDEPRSRGRRLPSTEHDDDDIRIRLFKAAHRKSSTGIGSTEEKEVIEELRKELEELKDHFDIERREIEQAHRLEITDIEEKHDQEKADLLNHIEREKVKLSDDFERLQQQALSELARELQTNFAHEKEDLILKHESQKNHLQQKFLDETNRLREELESEHQKELESQIEEVRSVYEQERFQAEEALAETQPIVNNLEEQNTQLVQKLSKQQELNTKLEQKLAEQKDLIEKLEQNLEEQSTQSQKKLAKQKAHNTQLEETLEEDNNQLKQKLLKLKDQNKLLEQKQESQKEQHENFKQNLEEQISKLELKLGKEKEEKEKLSENFEEQTKEFEQKLNNLKKLNTQLEQKLANKTEESNRELKRQKTEMEGMLTRHMQKLEDVEQQKHELELHYKKGNSDIEISFRKEKMDLTSEIDRQAQDIRELQRQKAELELELRQQRDELELSFRQEKQEILELYEEKIREMKQKLIESQKAQDNLLNEGEDALYGKLKDDFYRLVDDATKAKLVEEKKKLNENLKKEMEANFDTKQSELSHVFEKERTELVERYEGQIQSMRQELSRLQEKLDEEREILAQRFDSEKEGIEEQLAQQLRDELEEEFVQQMEEIRDAYEEEKHEYEAQANLLRQEVEELQSALDNEDKNRRKIDELKKANNKLQHERRLAEKGQTEMQNALESTKQALEARIDELMAEKEGAITAVKTQFVESSKQNGKDKAAFDALLVEKDVLEERVAALTSEVAELQGQANTVSDLQREVEKLKKDNLELCAHIEERHTDISHRQVPQHAQQAINELTREKSELEERLVDIQNKFEEVEDMAKKYSHLQFDYGQMTIGQSVIEETLLETQDKLADTEAKLMQCERELKDAQRYKDKYKLLQKKYEDVCKERDKVSNLAKSLKEQLNKANSAEREGHEDKGKLTSVLDEKKQLELQLQKISDKLLEATTNFSVSQSQHIRELQQWKEQCSNMVDLQKYTKLQIDLVDNQRSLRDLQELLKTKEETSTKVFKEKSEKHFEEVKSLEEQRESLMNKLTTLQQILDGQIDKFKQQYEASEKRNALVVDLYKENADLIDELSRVELQKKDAVSRCYKLEDQCNHLRRMLKKMAKVAIT